MTVISGVPMTITLGPLTDVDGDQLTYSISGTTNATLLSSGNEIEYINSAASGTETITISVTDSVNDPVTGSLTITVSAEIFQTM